MCWTKEETSERKIENVHFSVNLFVINIKIKLRKIVPKKFSMEARSCKKILYETHLSWDRIDGGQLVNPARPKTFYVKLDKYWWQTYTCSGSRSWSHPRWWNWCSTVNFSSCQRNLIRAFQIESIIVLITKMTLIFSSDLLKGQK